MYTVYTVHWVQTTPPYPAIIVAELNMSSSSHSISLLDQPLPGGVQEEISCLLLVDRPQFGEIFGADHRQRLAACTGLVTAVAWVGTSIVSHACIFYDDSCPHVGLLAHVFTHPTHRRKGLSALVCQALLQSWDRSHPHGSVVVLGTGSPHAAKVYQRESFTHLLGGLDMEMKGYNVDDMGEWIMVRDTFSLKRNMIEDPFHLKFFIEDSNLDNYSCVPLAPSHLPGLVLLFTCKDEQKKMLSIGVDTGLEAEEAVLRLLADKKQQEAEYVVVVHQPSNQVQGLAGGDMHYAVTEGATKWIETNRQKRS